MILIGPIDRFISQLKYELFIEDIALLLIYYNRKHYLIENKCGHFGIPLTKASIIENTIVCNGHGISFDLDSGEIVNRPYENCDPITIHRLIVKNEQLYWEK